MAYESLLRSFYKDASPNRYENAEALHDVRLNAESTFRSGIVLGEDELFLAVPTELSLLSDKVLRHERKIANGMRRLPMVAQRALVRGLVVDEVVSTNDLEGIYCTRRQIDELLQRDAATDHSNENKRFSGLASLYMDLYGDAPRLPRKPEDIRQIYDRVMDGEPLDMQHVPDGRLFRKDGVDILAPSGKIAHRGVEPESKVEELLSEMLRLTRSEEVPEMYGAIMGHFVFEYIHPFYDGNGRTGRYLLALALSHPLSILTSLSLSRVLAEHRGAYYTAFREAEHPMNHGELTSFVITVMKCVGEAQDELDYGLEGKRDACENLMGHLDGSVSGATLEGKDADIIKTLALLHLFAPFPATPLADIADEIGLGTQQTRARLRRLEAAGLVERCSKRPLRFCLTDRVADELGVAEP